MFFSLHSNFIHTFSISAFQSNPTSTNTNTSSSSSSSSSSDSNALSGMGASTAIIAARLSAGMRNGKHEVSVNPLTGLPLPEVGQIAPGTGSKRIEFAVDIVKAGLDGPAVVRAAMLDPRFLDARHPGAGLDAAARRYGRWRACAPQSTAV